VEVKNSPNRPQIINYLQKQVYVYNNFSKEHKFFTSFRVVSVTTSADLAASQQRFSCRVPQLLLNDTVVLYSPVAEAGD